jgi:hypothetical protein
VEFTTVAVADNGAWPTLSTFDANVATNNAGGANESSNDNDEGCGASASSASIAQSSAAPVNGTPYLSMTYNVDTNAGCGYQYASVGLPFVSQDLSGKTAIDFAIRSISTVRIMIRSKTVDPCLGAKNLMYIDIPSTAGAWQALNRSFSAFTLLNVGCPFPLADADFVSFVITDLGSGTLDLDNVSFP